MILVCSNVCLYELFWRQ